MELTKNISLRRLQWVGHVMRMKDERVHKKAFQRICNKKTSWKAQRKMDAVYRDAKMMLKCKNWRRSAENRDVWRRIIEEAKVQIGL